MLSILQEFITKEIQTTNVDLFETNKIQYMFECANNLHTYYHIIIYLSEYTQVNMTLWISTHLIVFGV